MNLLRWLGRKLRAPWHIACNLFVAWRDHDLHSYVHRVTQRPVRRFALRCALTLGSLLIACVTAAGVGLLWGFVILGALLWVLFMDLPGIWT